MSVKCFLNAILTCNETKNLCFLFSFLCELLSSVQLSTVLPPHSLGILMSLVYKVTTTLISAKVFLSLPYDFRFYWTRSSIFLEVESCPVYLYDFFYSFKAECDSFSREWINSSIFLKFSYHLIFLHSFPTDVTRFSLPLNNSEYSISVIRAKEQ